MLNNFSMKNLHIQIPVYKEEIQSQHSSRAHNQSSKQIKFNMLEVTSPEYKQAKFVSSSKNQYQTRSPLMPTLNYQNSVLRFEVKPKLNEQPKRPRILSKHTKCLSVINPSFSEQFKLGKTLGKGRFGNVSVARHIPSGAIFAVKVISLQKMSPKLSERLLAEIKIQSFLEHENCLQLYKCFRQDKYLYLILELGQTSLFDVLRKQKYLREKEAAYYLKQVIEALMFMHKHGVIHRDLKPENIILINNVAKLADFGWATYTPKEKRITFCGTLDYVSPQIVTGEFYDQMVDVWSVGVLCYQLCTGHAPFESVKSREDTYRKIVKVDVRYPKHLSAELQDFISKLLVRDPKKRMTLEESLEHRWFKLNQL